MWILYVADRCGCPSRVIIAGPAGVTGGAVYTCENGMAGVGVSFETRVLVLILCNIFAVQSAQVFCVFQRTLGNGLTLPI
jgi:hypothetical protein